jgi:hypothetical protein
MISGKAYRLNEYITENRNYFDIYIGSVSFEKRCMGVATFIKKYPKIINKVHFLNYFYLPPFTSLRRGQDIKDNRLKRIKLQRANRLKILTLLNGRAVFASKLIRDPLIDIARSIIEFFNDVPIRPGGTERICLDITTFTKPFIFLIIKLLLEKYKIQKLYIINTLPSKYTPSSLSFNILGTELMPAFNGIWDSRKRQVLIAIMGFEGNKLANIIGKYGFSDVIPIVGFPAFYPGLQDRALMANAEILKRFAALQNMKYAPSLDPILSYEVLSQIYKCYNDGYNVAIAPLGPKPIVLASAFFAVEHNLRVVYTFPQEYSCEYSQDIGESFLYEVNLT